MRKTIFVIGTAVVISGCATQNSETKYFLDREAAVVQACIPPVAKMTLQERFTVDPQTGRSPMRGATQCYTDQLNNVARMMFYQHSQIVTTYTNYLARLMAAQDRGEIATQSAIASYAQAQSLFRQAISAADARIAAQNRRSFADRLAILGATIAEQDRQRVNSAAASRPVTCTLTGVYVQNTMVCN